MDGLALPQDHRVLVVAVHLDRRIVAARRDGAPWIHATSSEPAVGAPVTKSIAASVMGVIVCISRVDCRQWSPGHEVPDVALAWLERRPPPTALAKYGSTSSFHFALISISAASGGQEGNSADEPAHSLPVGTVRLPAPGVIEDLLQRALDNDLLELAGHGVTARQPEPRVRHPPQPFAPVAAWPRVFHEPVFGELAQMERAA